MAPRLDYPGSNDTCFEKFIVSKLGTLRTSETTALQRISFLAQHNSVKDGRLNILQHGTIDGPKMRRAMKLLLTVDLQFKTVC